MDFRIFILGLLIGSLFTTSFILPRMVISGDGITGNVVFGSEFSAPEEIPTETLVDQSSSSETLPPIEEETTFIEETIEKVEETIVETISNYFKSGGSGGGSSKSSSNQQATVPEIIINSTNSTNTTNTINDTNVTIPVNNTNITIPLNNTNVSQNITIPNNNTNISNSMNNTNITNQTININSTNISQNITIPMNNSNSTGLCITPLDIQTPYDNSFFFQADGYGNYDVYNGNVHYVKVGDAGFLGNIIMLMEGLNLQINQFTTQQGVIAYHAPHFGAYLIGNVVVDGIFGFEFTNAITLGCGS